MQPDHVKQDWGNKVPPSKPFINCKVESTETTDNFYVYIST